jgi:hypothetical protein
MHVVFGVEFSSVFVLLFLLFGVSANQPLGFEQANQPTLSDIERRNLLNFCIVGMYFFSLYPSIRLIYGSNRRGTYWGRICGRAA